MKKAVLAMILCLAIIEPSFALNKIEAMNFLTINALMRYGKNLYDRGDFNEASAVFKHVLTYDVHQPQALRYLKEMGQPIDLSDIEGVKKAIEVKKQSIQKLRSQVLHMQENFASQSTEQ